MRQVYLYFAIGLTLVYISFSPASIAAMGYTGEDMRTGTQMLSWLAHRPVTVEMPRNGPLPVLVDLPFLATGMLLFANADRGEEIVLAFEPCILTALTVTLILIWTHRLTRNLRYALFIGLMSAFCTMLWPYAYIGLETKQSFFLLLTAFLALEFSGPRLWWAVLLFCVSASFTIGSKSTGAFLLPVTGYLVWHFLMRLRAEPARVFRLMPTVLCVLIPAFIFLVNSHERSLFWAKNGGSAAFIKAWMVTDATWPFLNFASFFGSANKGLWVFSPLCILGCYALPQAWRDHRKIAWFALLTLAGLAGGFSILRNWADETWGPRYLHSAIAPLSIVFAIVWYRMMSSNTVRTIVGSLAVLGFITAALGAGFPYGFLSVAANMTGQNTLEGYQGDITLNHLRFNAKLLELWLHPERNGLFTSDRKWFYERPAGTPPPKTFDLHVLARPQPVLIVFWRQARVDIVARLWLFYCTCLVIGCLLLFGAVWRTNRLTKREYSHSALPITI